MNSPDDDRVMHMIAMRHIEQDAAVQALLALICQEFAPGDPEKQKQLARQFELLKQRLIERELIDYEDKDPAGAAFLANPPPPPKTPTEPPSRAESP